MAVADVWLIRLWLGSSQLLLLLVATSERESEPPELLLLLPPETIIQYAQTTNLKSNLFITSENTRASAKLKRTNQCFEKYTDQGKQIYSSF